MLMYRCRRKCIGDLRKKRAQEAGQGNCEFYDIVLSGRIVISLETEFIENEKEDVGKQRIV